MLNHARRIAVAACLVATFTGGCADLFGPAPAAGPQPASAAQSTATNASATSAASVQDDLTARLLEAERARLDEYEAAADPSLIPQREPGPLRTEIHSDALAVSGKLAQRRSGIEQLVRQPDPRALPELARILADRKDLLSPLAAIALGKLHEPEALSALEAALGDTRPVVRQVVLSVLVERRSPGVEQHCLVLFEQDQVPAVRAAAAAGLGTLWVEQAQPQLEQALQREAPVVRYAAAWALARMHKDSGRRFLETLAAAEDPQTSPQAILAIGQLAQASMLPTLYRCLYSHKEPIWQTALEALRMVPPEAIRAGLSDLGQGQRDSLLLRQAMLECLSGRAKLPLECMVAVERGDRQEKILALRCLGTAGGIDAVPPAVDALEDSDAGVQVAAAQALDQLRQRHNLPEHEPGAVDWRRWWFQQHRLIGTGTGVAEILRPDGRRVRVRVGSRLDWNAVVVDIPPGAGEPSGAVILQAGNRRLEIRSSLLPSAAQTPQPRRP